MDISGGLSFHELNAYLDLVYSQHMGSELHQQNNRISDIGSRTEMTHDSIRDVQRNTRKDFRLRVK